MVDESGTSTAYGCLVITVIGENVVGGLGDACLLVTGRTAVRAVGGTGGSTGEYNSTCVADESSISDREK